MMEKQQKQQQQQRQPEQRAKATAATKEATTGAATKGAAAKRTNIYDLPPEIICEIAKYNPASSAKLGLTCKAFNKILEKELKENQEAFNHNKDVYERIEGLQQYRNEIAANFLMMPDWISQEEYREIMKDVSKRYEKLVKQRKCINCKRLSKDMSKRIVYYTFYTENICNDCAHLCFNVDPIRINKIGPEKKKGKGRKKRNTNNNNNNN
jgi:hypothetical protein